ncbi:MAG: HEAT repeat domain-containing protein [Planctomycetota bacterium]|jgi:hypothetical protein
MSEVQGSRTNDGDSVVPARTDEEALLDEALQQADDRLVVSLREDELRRRRRRRWAIVGGMAMSIVVVGIITGLMLTGTDARPAKAPNGEAIDRAAWESKIKNLKTHNQTAFSVGPQLVSLDPDVGFKVVQNTWPDLTSLDVKTGLLKAFAFARHPRILDVLHIGATDKSLKVRNYAFSYLENYAFQSFAEDVGAYKKWYGEFGKKPVEEVLKVNCQRYVNRLNEAKDEERERLARQLRDYDLGSGTRKTSYVSKRRYLIDAGLLDVVKGWLSLPNASRDVISGASHVLVHLKPDEAYFRRTILPLTTRDKSDEIRNTAINVLGSPEHKWAVDYLLKMLVKESSSTITWTIAGALADIGDPRVIPTMIAVIEADNTYNTVYGVGYFGLGKLTGVKYDESHDGVWWRKWWEKNKKNYSEDVQSLEIPTLSKTDTYDREAQTQTAKCNQGVNNFSIG